jgi:hypothetical protein
MTKTFEQRVSAKLATLSTVADVTKLAKSIAGRADNLDVDMHAAGCGALMCAIEHGGNTSAAVAVINSLGKHTRAKAFGTWIEDHSNILLTLDKKTGLWTGKIVDAADRKDQDTLRELAVKAQAAPFWSVEEKSATDFSLHAAIRALLKKGETAQKKGIMSEADRLALQDLNGIAERIKPVEVAQSTAGAPAADADADKLETVG